MSGNPVRACRAWRKVQALALLTGFTVRFFYEPPFPPLGRVWVCGSDGCHLLESESAP